MAENETSFVVEQEEPVVVMERVFPAPRELVYQALTDPEHVKRWQRPRWLTTPIAELDVRPGGAYRMANQDSDGKLYRFWGEYREVVPNERLVYTWIYEGSPESEAIITEVLEDHDGATKLIVTTEFPSFEDRQEYLDADAEKGARDSWEMLAELLDEMPRDG